MTRKREATGWKRERRRKRKRFAARTHCIMRWFCPNDAKEVAERALKEEGSVVREEGLDA